MQHIFNQQSTDRPSPIINGAEGIPIIDLSSITLNNHLSKENDYCFDVNHIPSFLITEIGSACEKWGFFQVTNHVVPLEKLEKLELIARKFFALSPEKKKKVGRDEAHPMGYYDSEHTKNVKDWKQVFDFTAKDPSFIPVSPDDLQPRQLINCWPQSLPEFRDVAHEYAREVEKLGFKLLELIALSLGLEANKLNSYGRDHASFVRLNYYPPCPSPQLVLGVNQHKDAGALTILAQDGVGGLQVWSNDKYESVEHRVMVNSDKERLSIPFFFYPAHYIMVKPLEEMVDDQNPPKYKEYNWGAFFAAKRNSNLKKLDVENLQISHFRIVKQSAT
ncbi:Protein DMR6-LIKE OXYGENASE 1 [Bienertia sinuspersici]